MRIDDVLKNFHDTQARLTRVAEDFPWEDRDAYVGFLAQSYEYVRASTRILALTAGRLPAGQTPLSNRFIQHAAEEKGHDRLLLNDAKALGADLAATPVLPEAEAFHKSLYYWIYQGDPMAILGWVLCLEGFAVANGSAIHARVERAHGKRAASFLAVHSAEDPDHVEKALAELRKLGEPELATVCHGIQLYSSLYARIYAAIRERRKVVQLAAA